MNIRMEKGQEITSKSIERLENYKIGEVEILDGKEQELNKIQTEEKLSVSGKLDQETLEKINALIFSKYLQEDLSYQKAVTQLKEELKNDTN